MAWALGAVNDRELALRALDTAVKRTGARAAASPDRACTFASEDCRPRLEVLGIACSIGRRGNCHGDAVIESWFATGKSDDGNASRASGLFHTRDRDEGQSSTHDHRHSPLPFARETAGLCEARRPRW